MAEDEAEVSKILFSDLLIAHRSCKNIIKRN